MEYSWLLGNAIGFALKKWNKFNNKFIPAAIFVFNVIFHALASLGATPVLPSAGLMLFVWTGLGTILLQGAVDTAKAVALHTIAKNTLLEGIVKMFGSKKG